MDVDDKAGWGYRDGDSLLIGGFEAKQCIHVQRDHCDSGFQIRDKLPI